MYQATCECGVNYIGKTTQTLDIRLNGHRKGGNEHSALSRHLNYTKHKLELENVAILNRENHHQVLLFKEMIYIKNTNNINNVLDYAKLGSTYDGVFNKIFGRRKKLIHPNV